MTYFTLNMQPTASTTEMACAAAMANSLDDSAYQTSSKPSAEAKKVSDASQSGSVALEGALTGDLADKGLPLVFLHGVGGLPTYLEMLRQVMALRHPMLVVQFDGISLRLKPVLPVDGVVQQLQGVLDTLGVDKACVIGHSYGTFVASRLAQLHPAHVKSMCLFDPVCMGMFMPHLLSSFLYSTPQWMGLRNVVDYVKRVAVYFISRELHVCATFSRSFFWTDLCLWPEDLPAGSAVLLSGRDDLMDPQLVRHMVQDQQHIKVHFSPNPTHGEFVISPEVKQAAIREIQNMLRRGGSMLVRPAGRMLSRTLTATSSVFNRAGLLRMRSDAGWDPSMSKTTAEISSAPSPEHPQLPCKSYPAPGETSAMDLA